MKQEALTVFRPETEIKASVVVVHGMAEHHNRYAEFARYLCANGYAVYTYDLPGHGKNTDSDADLGWFGEAGGWNRLLNSIDEVCKIAKDDNPEKTVAIFAHSMGTILTRCYLQAHDADVDAVILSGAPNYQSAAGLGIALGKAISKFKGKKGHSKLMDQMVTGNFNKSVKDPKTDVDWLSFNEENVQNYIADPYCGFGFTIQGYMDELQGVIDMHDTSRYNVKNKDLPIQLFAGEDDPCIGGKEGIEDSVNTLKAAGFRNVNYKLWQGMRHETLNEKENKKVYAYTVEVLDGCFA